jgi:hypothetical protein
MLLLAAFLSTTADGRWRPAIGDPSVVGWITVLAYFLAALLAGRTALASRRCAGLSSAPQEARLVFRFWLAIAWLLVVLGVNKQLDLQTLLTQLLRDLAQAQGWYENRRPYQIGFILVIGAAGAAGTTLLALRLRPVVRRVWVGVLGVGLLVSFVLIRAASFHHVDLLLKRGTVHLNWLLELGSIAVLGLGALRERSLQEPAKQPASSTAS